MVANTSPIYTLTPNVQFVKIPTTNAVAKSDGSSAGSGTDLMYNVFTAGADGSFVDRVRFFSVASTANTTGVATTLRVFLSTVSSPGATTAANTELLGEVSVPAIASGHSTNATAPFEVVLGFPIESGQYIHVCQHVAQTTNQQWGALCIGGDY